MTKDEIKAFIRYQNRENRETKKALDRANRKR